jgi:hypothetical protein
MSCLTAEITAIAAADLVHDMISLFLTKAPPKAPHFGGYPVKLEL